jgi:hypothetical protein
MFMQSKKIIIISASEQIKAFFKLEALNLNLSVECIEKIDRAHNDLSSYDLAIIDIDTVRQMPLNNARTALTVSACKENADISYPCLISEVRKIYNALYAQSSIKSDSNKNQNVKIIFYSDTKKLVSVNEKNIFYPTPNIKYYQCFVKMQIKQFYERKYRSFLKTVAVT